MDWAMDWELSLEMMTPLQTRQVVATPHKILICKILNINLSSCSSLHVSQQSFSTSFAVFI
jgi:hypothetical protein